MSTKYTRENKGKNLIEVPTSFIIIDVESTGLDPEYDSIIEIGAIKVENGEIIDTFESLIKPNDYYEYKDASTGLICKEYIDNFITSLTGITNKMLETAPSPDEVLPNLLEFIDGSILLGQNVNFDINFLYDLSLKYENKYISNDFVDLIRLARKIYPNLKSYKLSKLAEFLSVDTKSSHRALADCYTTLDCYNILCQKITEENIDLKSLWAHKKRINLKEISTNKTNFDTEHIFHDKNLVFTGKLEKMERKKAAQLVVDLGGYCLNTVTKKANFLILGNLDYCSNIKGNKTSKIKKAEKYILEGQDLTVISENVFYDLIEN